MKQRKPVGNTYSEILLYTCKCGSTRHQIDLGWFEDDKDEAYMSFQIDAKTLWHRLKIIVSYLFKGGSIHQQEVLLDRDDMIEMNKGIKKFLTKK